MRGFKVLAVSLSVLVAFTLVACDQQPTEPDSQQATFAKKSPVENNGAPSGAHYNLNLIGTNVKNPDPNWDSGHRIFVPLSGHTRIMLTESTGGFYFEVTDANGTDGEAGFMLPNPDPDCDGVTWYSVYYRLVGTPGGSSTIQSCIKDAGTWYCAADVAGGVVAVTRTRNNSKPVFENVSKDLLYVDVCTAWTAGVGSTCTTSHQTPLFGDSNYMYAWDYDNTGARVAQLRFYEVPTDTGWSPSGNQCTS